MLILSPYVSIWHSDLEVDPRKRVFTGALCFPDFLDILQMARIQFLTMKHKLCLTPLHLPTSVRLNKYIVPCFCNVPRLKKEILSLSFSKCDFIIIWIPKYLCISEQQFTLSSDPVTVLMFHTLKSPGLASWAGTTSCHQPVNQAGLKYIAGMVPSPEPVVLFRVGDLIKYRLQEKVFWVKPKNLQGEVEAIDDNGDKLHIWN